MQHSFRQYYLYREALRIYNQDEPRQPSISGGPQLGLYQPREEEPEQPEQKLTKTGRIRLKRQAPAPVKDMSWLQDVGVDPNDMQQDTTTPDRIKQIRVIERTKGIPFVSWVVGHIKDNGSMKGQPADAVWNAIKMGRINPAELEQALALTANTGLGKMHAHEFMNILPYINWVPPKDDQHMRNLPAENGMIDDKAAKVLTRRRRM